MIMTEIKEKSFELKLTEMSTGAGAIPVTWCLSESWLKGNSVKDFYVLLSTYNPTPNGKTAEWRGYVKLSDMMTYVTFLRPGVNRISACLVRNEEVVKNWMKREGGRWSDDVVSFPKYDSELEMDKNGEWEYRLGSYSYQDHLQVEIPSECFAPEPWEIEKTWVNWLWKYKSVDQCEFRKRRMLAYSVQPIIFLFLMVVRVLLMFACLTVALKGLKWGPIFSPLNYDTLDICNDVEKSYFTVSKWEIPNSFVFIPSLPIALIIGFINVATGLKSGILSVCLYAISGALFIPVVILCVMVLTYCVNNVTFGKKIGAFIDKWFEARDAQADIRNAERQRYYQEMMTCSSTRVIRKLSDLPKDKRTIRLRFLGVKSMVCRPFAR